MPEEIANIRFAGINIISKYLGDPPLMPVSELFLFDVRIETKVNAEMKFVMPFVEVAIRQENSDVVLAKLVMACIFEIQNFETHIQPNSTGQYVVPPDIDLSLRQAAVSTARGIIFSELRGTYLHNAIMPLIYVQNMSPNPPQTM